MILAALRRRKRRRQKRERELWAAELKQHLALMSAPNDPNVIDVAFKVEGATEFTQPPANLLPPPYYWITKTGVRHNEWCGWYRNCAGRVVRTPEGTPCHLCGG